MLLQDGFGNYCLQYVVDLEQTDVNIAVLKRLTGHFPELSQQKFSSNVVEKCLRIKDPKLQEMQYTVIKELMESPLLPRLLQASLETKHNLKTGRRHQTFGFNSEVIIVCGLFPRLIYLAGRLQA